VNKRVWKNLENKMAVLFPLAAVILSIGIYLINYSQYYSLTIEELKLDAINVHSYAERIINTRGFTHINTIEDEGSELYNNIRLQLDEIRRIANILYLYTIKLNDNGEFIYLVDGMDRDDENFCHVGTLVEDEYISMLIQCMNDEIVFGDRIVNTDYGILYHVFFPFHDYEGNVIGVIGIDFNCEDLYHSMNRTRLMTILITIVLVCGFTLVIFFIVKKVVRSTEKIFVKTENEAEEAKDKMLKEVEYRSKLLSVSNEMALLLHKSDINSFDNALLQSMGAIARLIDVDSINLWKNRTEGDELCCSQIFDYSPKGSVYSNDDVYKYDEFMPEWKETLAKGVHISGLVRDMSPVTRGNFASTGLLSALIMPIFIEDQFWGFVCFDDYQNERVFTKDEETILHTVTLVIASSFLRNRMVRKINDNTVQLEAALEAAEQSSRSKSVFLAQMSHEIRTPMNAILGIAEIQLRNSILSDDVEEGLLIIYESGSLLLNIINDILDLSKIDAGELEIVPAKYYIPGLINDIVQLNRMRYDSKPIEFILSVDENMPAELIGDELRIKQIFNNLLSNAYKFTDTGEIEVSVTVKSENNNNTVSLVFQISDTGQGMNESQISRLFDEYARFNIEKNRNIAGTGLGMNITKRLIDMMNGEITIESVVDKGSVFIVRLPQEASGSQVCGSEIAEKLRTFTYHNKFASKTVKTTSKLMPNGRVLVVDDVHTNLYVAQGMLLPYGLVIETANNGFEAIEKIKNDTKYDIVFMDHMMPKMDGIKATKIIREMGYKHPIVALTANAVAGQAEMFLANGFDAFIAKPVDSYELDKLLTRFIKNKKPVENLDAVNSTVSSSMVEKLFVLDAENTVNVLQELSVKLNNLNNEELESYVVIVHGMKSALAGIGEKELSAAAYRLEQAGGKRDFNLLQNETPAFINELSLLIRKFKPAETDNNADISGEDKVFLCGKLDEIKTACESYNMKAAKTALADLKQRLWPRKIDGICDEIFIGLLRGEFKKVMSTIENTINMYNH